MATRERNKSGGTTNHGIEIDAMRRQVAMTMQEWPSSPDMPQELFHETTILAAAADLLEVHDSSGISLDDWIGPRMLVETAMMIIDLPRETFLENHV